MATCLNSEALIKTTLITEQFSFIDYLGPDKKTHLPLFAIDPQNRIYVFSADFNFSPNTGWKVIGLPLQN